MPHASIVIVSSFSSLNKDDCHCLDLTIYGHLCCSIDDTLKLQQTTTTFPLKPIVRISISDPKADEYVKSGVSNNEAHKEENSGEILFHMLHMF